MSVVVGVATVVLVMVTGYYAWQNRRMAIEMEQSRRLSVRPHRALQLAYISPTVAAVRLTNIGNGPAVDVDGTLRMLPSEGGSLPLESRDFQETFIAPGRRRGDAAATEA